MKTNQTDATGGDLETKAAKKGGWKRIAKRALAGVGVAAAAFGGWVYASTEARFHAHYEVSEAELTVPNTYEAIARGEHVIRALAKCTDCHGQDLGGGILVDDPAVGRLSAPNLTRAGIGGKRTDAELVKALTHGVAPDGRPLAVMPSHEIRELGEEDLAAVVAYLRNAPPVEREMPKLVVGPVIRVMFALGKVDLLPAEKIDHTKGRRTAPTPEPTPAYGEYLAKSGGCFGCHGPELKGGPIPGMPPSAPHAADIRASKIGTWTFEQFDHTLRTGQNPEGRQIADLMPWRATAQMNEVEMRALYAYLSRRPAGGEKTALTP